MRRILTLLLAISLSFFLSSSAVMAEENRTENFDAGPGGVHYVKGTTLPECTVSGLDVTCPSTTFELAGVGNNNASALLLVRYSAVIDCNNPSTANENNPIESHTHTFAVPKEDPDLEPKNGRLTLIPLSVTGPTLNEVLASADCPNDNWVPEVQPGTLQLVSYEYTVTFVGFTDPVITITGP